MMMSVQHQLHTFGVQRLQQMAERGRAAAGTQAVHQLLGEAELLQLPLPAKGHLRKKEVEVEKDQLWTKNGFEKKDWKRIASK